MEQILSRPTQTPRWPSTLPANISNSLNKLTNLTNLTFGIDFNQPLYNSLNQLHNLTHLTFGSKFNNSVNNLPINIKTITFNSNNKYKKEDFVKYKKVEILFK